MYNVQSMDQNLWANNSYTVPFLNYVDAYSPQPAITPVGYYDPSMQYIQVHFCLFYNPSLHLHMQCTLIYICMFCLELV